MNIFEVVTEAFTDPYPFREKYNDPDLASYTFVTKQDIDYTVTFSSKGGVTEVVFNAVQVTPHGTTSTVDITNTGDANRVFATVIEIVKAFLAKRKPSYIRFGAKSTEPSRVKLYRVIAAQASKVLANYEFSKEADAGREVAFTLKRKSKKI